MDQLQASAGARLAPTSLLYLRKDTSATGATAVHVTVVQRDCHTHPPRRASTPAERSVLRSHAKWSAGATLRAMTALALQTAAAGARLVAVRAVVCVLRRLVVERHPRLLEDGIDRRLEVRP
jgi:hypothetical protein